MSKILINFSEFRLEIVANIVLLSKRHSQAFGKLKFLEEKCVSFERWVQKHWPMLLKARITCAVFFGAKSRTEIFFGFGATSLQSVLSKVQSNCPKRFVVIIFEGLQLFFWNGGLIFDDWSVRITFYVCRGTFCREKWFLWKLSWKSSEDVVESEFHVCGDMLWEKFLKLLKKRFSAAGQKFFPRVLGNRWREFQRIKNYFHSFQLLSWICLAEIVRTTLRVQATFFLEKSGKRWVSLDIARKDCSRCCQRCIVIVEKVL